MSEQLRRAAKKLAEAGILESGLLAELVRMQPKAPDEELIDALVSTGMSKGRSSSILRIAWIRGLRRAKPSNRIKTTRTQKGLKQATKALTQLVDELVRHQDLDEATPAIEDLLCRLNKANNAVTKLMA